VLFGVGWVLAFSGLFAVQFVRSPPPRGSSGFPGGFALAALGLLVCVLGGACVVLGKKLRMVKFVIEPGDGPDPAVVYLRSFGDDKEYVPSPPGALFPRRTVEEDLTETLASIARPIVAIGRPGERLPSVGAYRCYVGDDRWQATVGQLLARTRFVVMRMGETPGLRWELSQCVRDLAPEQLVLWLPNVQFANKQMRRRRVERYEAFRAWASGILPRGLPAEIGDARFIGFDTDWVPRVVAVAGTTARDFFLSTRFSYGASNQFEPMCRELSEALRLTAERPTFRTFALRAPLVIVCAMVLTPVVLMVALGVFFVLVFGLRHLFGLDPL
jgi:hypothetical protein